MTVDVSAWHYWLCDAIVAKDVAKAREVCDTVMAEQGFEQDHPVHQALRLLVASHVGHRGWLEEAEASLERNVELPAVQPQLQQDARASGYFLAGLMRLDEPARAAAHFESALALLPRFLPARVELECLRRGVDRVELFGALGVEIPRSDWRYLLAASELGLDLGLKGADPPIGAICIRGLVTAETAALVRLYRTLNPTTPIVVSTWNDTPADLLDPFRGIAHTVVIAPPDKPGSQNKNRQIMLARAALTIARPHVGRVLLVRTDIAMFSAEILSSLDAMHAKYPVAAGAMDGRLVICDLFTRKFRDYHTSDILAYGTADDVLRFWSAPYEDPNEYTNTEAYLGWHLWASVQPNHYSHAENYRRLLRDYIIVRDFDWFNGLWLRFPNLRNGLGLNFGDACVSQRDWEQLYYASDLDRVNLMGDTGVVMYEVLAGA